MPVPKKMHKKKKSIDEASEALLKELSSNGDYAEEREEKKDDPFVDEEGDLLVVPTMESLSELVEHEGSANNVPVVEILRRNLRVTLRAIEMAELAYHITPKQGTATALTQMQNMAKELMKSMEDHQDPEAFANELCETILKPMCMTFVKTLTTEIDRKRASLMSIIDAERAGVVRHELSDLLQGTSKGLDEGYEDARRRLYEILSGKRDKKGKK